MMVGLLHFLKELQHLSKPIRRGTAHIIKTFKPIVIPIVIDGLEDLLIKKELN